MSFDELIQKNIIADADAIQIRDNLDYVLQVLESRANYFRYQYQDAARAVAYDTAEMMILYAVTNQREKLEQFVGYDKEEN